jgi:hypothetical protein
MDLTIAGAGASGSTAHRCGIRRGADRMPTAFARSVLALALLCCGRAMAQHAAPAADVFPRAWFDAAGATNAYEMLKRVPGFTIVDADADVRGYGEALGNVIIDGSRPSSKREDIDDLLERIPADSVLRIELIRSGRPGIDMGGHALLANVVRVQSATTRGAVEFGAAGATDGWAAPGGRFEYGRQSRGRSLDIALRYDPELDDDSGRGDIRTSRADGTTEVEALDTRTAKGKGEATVGWRQPLAGGTLTLDAALRGERERDRTTTTPLDDEASAEHVRKTEDTRETEFGARYKHPAGERTSLELLASRRDAELDGREASDGGGDGGDSESFEEGTRSSETIARIDLLHEAGARLALNASLEAARNTLDSHARLGSGGGAVVALPGSEVDIAERRYEAAAGLSWKASDALDLEAGLRIEQSTIAQGGDAALQRSFRYAKPRVAARWSPDADDRFRLSFSREVGQLDFEDFVASASLDTGSVSAGNAELRPDQTWRLQLEWERRLGEDAALTLGWTHDRIDDVIDRVLVVAADDTFDAPGNIGRGRRDTLSLDWSAPLGALRLPNGRIHASLQYRDSSVTDPFTGRPRRISEEKPIEGEIAITGEMPRWNTSWGLTVEHIAERESKYRFDRIERKSEGAGWTLSVERRFAHGWRLRVEATDLAGRDFEDVRERYAGVRPLSPLRDREVRRRRAPGTFSLALRHDFGR